MSWLVEVELSGLQQHTERAAFLRQVLKPDLEGNAVSALGRNGGDVAPGVALEISVLEESILRKGSTVSHSNRVVSDWQCILTKDLADQGGRENGESCLHLHLERKGYVAD